MIKIGFIDYFLDEWHAQNYPSMIKEASGGEQVVAYGYGKIEGTGFGRKTNAEWAEAHNAVLCQTIEEVIKNSDVLVVLSPDHPQFHEVLSQEALRSGKPTYIDKTFTNDKAAAARIFKLAGEYSTPVYSTSALRFSKGYEAVEKEGITGIVSIGGGEYDNYLIHQLEPISCLMGTAVSRVLALGTDEASSILLQFADKRYAAINFFANVDFELHIAYKNGDCITAFAGGEFFKAFIKALTEFFTTGVPRVDKEDTISLMGIREACLLAQKNRGEWVLVG